MEVLSFITDAPNLINLFDDFLKGYKKLKEGGRDYDTAYFVDPATNRNELYFHFIPNDVEHEFSINYSEAEVQTIRSHFKESAIIIFDIQYKGEIFLNQLLRDFLSFLQDKEIIVAQQILISHTFRGIISWDEFGTAR